MVTSNIATINVQDNTGRPSVVVINSDKTISINVRKTFPVYMYGTCEAYFEGKTNLNVSPCNPSTNKEFTFSVGPLYYTNYPTMDYKNKFEQAGEFYTLFAPASDSMPQELIDSPSFFGFYNYDEPEYIGKTVDEIRRVYTKTKLRDTNHPVIINLGTDDAKVWEYVTDILSFDGYPIRDRWINPSSQYYQYPREDAIYAYEYWTAGGVLRNAKNLNTLSIPIWAVLQGQGVIDTAGVLPATDKEIRTNSYVAITMDVKGIS